MRDHAAQRVFCAVRGEVRDLRLECADQIRGRVDDRAAEREDRVGIAAQRGRKLCRFRIEADADQRVVFLPGLLE
jgi:hypothetical protein